MWRSPKTSSDASDSGGGAESPTNCDAKHALHNMQQPYFLPSNQPNKPACSLPLLQIWPSQDSPRGEGDGQSFIFSVNCDETVSLLKRTKAYCWQTKFLLNIYRVQGVIQHLLNNHVVELH